MTDGMPIVIIMVTVISIAFFKNRIPSTLLLGSIPLNKNPAHRRVFLFFNHLSHRCADIGRTLNYMNPAFVQDLHFCCSSIFCTTDDGTGMAHPAAGRSSLSGYKPNDRFLVSVLEAAAIAHRRHRFAGDAGDRAARALRLPSRRGVALGLRRDGGDRAVVQLFRRRRAGVPESLDPAPPRADAVGAAVRDRAGRVAVDFCGAWIPGGEALPAGVGSLHGRRHCRGGT